MTRTLSLSRRALALALTAVVVLAGCGGDDGDGSSGELKVFADVRLEPALSAYAKDFPDAKVRFTFGQPGELADRLRKDLSAADVFVSADSVDPDALWNENHVDGPVVFAANRLVLAVPAGSKIGSLDDAAKKGVRLAVGTEESPLGRYTRQALGKLGETGLDLLANAAAEAKDSTGVVEKVRAGDLDGGVAYLTEIGDLERIDIEGGSGALSEAALVLKTKDRKAAEAFIEGLVSNQGQDAVRNAGFLPATQP